MRNWKILFYFLEKSGYILNGFMDIENNSHSDIKCKVNKAAKQILIMQIIYLVPQIHIKPSTR